MNDKQLQLVTFEQAKRLKALGFDWETYNFYDKLQDNLLCLNPLICFIDNHNKDKKKYSAPTVALALKWFRDVKNIDSGVERISHKDKRGWYLISKGFENYTDIFEDYESVESELLNELVRYELEKLERDKHITDRDLEDKEHSYFDSESY